MPAKTGCKPLGFPCPNPQCKLEYGHINIEYQEEWWNNKRREKPKGKTYESYRKKKRDELKPAEIALKDIIVVLFGKFLHKSFETPDFDKMLSLIQDPKKQREVEEIAKSVTTSVQTRYSVMQEEINEDEIKYAKWDVVEEIDVNSREYILTKKVHKMTPINFQVQDQNQDIKEEKGKNGKITITWNPIKEIKRYRRCGDPLRHIDLDLIWNFITSKVVIKYPSIISDYLSGQNQLVIKDALDTVNKYRGQFSNKNWSYLWFEWFWIVRYSKINTPRMAANMVEALDDKKGNISPKQIKNKSIQTLDFLEKFFYSSHIIFTFIQIILQIIKRDPFLKKEYDEILEKCKRENAVIIDSIIKKQGVYQQQNMHIISSTTTNNNLPLNDGNEELKRKRKRSLRIRITHHNPYYQNEMDEFKNKKKKYTTVEKKKM